MHIYTWTKIARKRILDENDANNAEWILRYDSPWSFEKSSQSFFVMSRELLMSPTWLNVSDAVFYFAEIILETYPSVRHSDNRK